jgi:isocitrate lyase
MLRPALVAVPRRVLYLGVSRHIRQNPTMSWPPKYIKHFHSTTAYSDNYQLLSTTCKAGRAEDVFHEEQINEVERWWASPRFQGIKRPYSAADVVTKRGSLKQTYPCSIMARKLFNLLNKRQEEASPLHTSKSYGSGEGGIY